MSLPDIKGVVSDDDKIIDSYRMDMSRYNIKPRLVAFPADEDDIVTLVDYCRENSIPITPRGSGSNLSGSAVGRGMIIVFNKMRRFIEQKDNTVRVQPGIIYNSLNESIRPQNLLLPYNPSSRAFCTVGGNVGTKASGLRSIKYGNVDDFLVNLRFVSPKYGIVDTREGLPPELDTKVLEVRKALVADDNAMELLRSRQNIKTSSGYNIRSLYRYEQPQDIVTHLMVGSVGTLGVFSELTMNLVPLSTDIFIFLCFFDDIASAGAMVKKAVKLNPSAVELMDDFGIGIYREKMGLDILEKYHAMLLLEFDEASDLIKGTVTEFLEKEKIFFHPFEEPVQVQKAWDIRESVLINIKKEHESEERKYISFVDDLGVPVDRLGDFISEIAGIFTQRNIEFVVYGHVGEGNLHVRPLIARENWKENMRTLADLCVKTAFKYGGTVSGEHGSGRNRSFYIREEWGQGIYEYFRRVKEIFDPNGLLNPGVMLMDTDITENLEF